MRKQGFVRADSDPFEQITGSNAQFGVADGAGLITGARGDRERMFIASGRDYESVPSVLQPYRKQEHMEHMEHMEQYIVYVPHCQDT